MADFTSFSSMEAPVPYILAASSSSSSSTTTGGGGGAVVDDTFEDACSICLDLFTSQNPATVTSCKHEYHLQCILDWSQRSKECPICWQLLVLKDAASQELLVAVASERQLRTCNVSLTGFRTLQNFHEDFDAEEEASYSDDSDFDERVMQKLAFAASRARYVQRSEQHRSSGHCPSQFLLFTSSSNVHEEQQLHLTSPGEGPRLSHGSSDGDGLPSLSPPKSSPSETFSESMKSRWSAASSRCKESFTKGTRGLKEKLLARNDSVKELSKGVQREMSAGVTRMIEKLDLSSKQTEASVPLSGLGTSNFFLKGKAVQENTIVHSVNISNEEIAYDLQSSDTPSFVSDAMHTKLEASHAK